MHTHSCYSKDALTKPETMLKTVKKLGIGFAITDHNLIGAWKHFKNTDVPIIFGEEIKVFDNGKCVGEFLGYFLQEKIEKGSYGEVLDALKSQDALISIAHPFDVLRKPFKYLKEVAKKIDLIEGYNSRAYFEKFNDQAKQFAEENSLPLSAGSDAHTPWEIGNAYADIETDSLEEFRKLLVKGKAKYYYKKSSYSVHVWTQLAKFELVKDK